MIPYEIVFDDKADKLRIRLPDHLLLVEEFLEIEILSRPREGRNLRQDTTSGIWERGSIRWYWKFIQLRNKKR